MNENPDNSMQSENSQQQAFVPNPGMFVENEEIAREMLGGFGEDPKPNPMPPVPPKKKKKGLKIAIISGVAAVLLIGATLALPLLFMKLGNSKVASGDYSGATNMYSLCFGLYGSDIRIKASSALAVAMKENGLNEGISKALSDGIKVHLTYDLNGGRFINSSRQTDVLLTEPGQFADLYKATKENYEFLGWDLEISSYAPDFDDSVINLSLKAQFSPAVYKISYTNLYSDEQINPTEYTCETDTITLSNPSRVGYTFVSWKGSDIDGELRTVIIPQGSSGDRAYIANWSANKYTVEFNPDIDCDIDKTVTVTYDDEYLFPTIEKRGYTFKGWSDGENTYTTGLWGLAHDVSVSPVWKLNVYNLSYDLGGGSVSSNLTRTYTVLDGKINIENPTRHGYTFLGWTYNEKTTPEKNVSIPANSVGNISFKANWVGNNHKLTLNANGGTGAPATLTVTYGSTYTVPTLTRTGYTFLGWYNGNSKVESGTWNLDQDMSISAKWKANEYNISFNSSGAGSVSGKTVEYDSHVSLPSVSKTGYNFLGWYNGNTKVDSGTWKIASNVILTAKWQAKTYTVSLNASGGTTSSSKYTVTYGSKYTLPQATRKGYNFLGWYNGYSQFPSSGTWTNQNNVSLTAKWEIKSYKISLNASGGYVSSSSKSVNYGGYYSLPTPTRDGYTFLGWYDGLSQFQASGYYNYDKDIQLVAQWRMKTSTVTFNPNGGMVENSSRTYSYGSSYTLPTPVRKGYEFLGWYNGYTKYSNSGTWNHEGNITLTAKWEAKTYTIRLNGNGAYLSRSVYYVKYGETYTLPTPSRRGYTFFGWVGDQIYPTTGVFLYDHDLEMAAIWIPLN